MPGSLLKFFVGVLVVTGLSALLLANVSNTVAILLASVAIGLLGGYLLFTLGASRSSRADSVLAATAQASSDQWSADEWQSWAREQASLLQSESEAVAERERRLTEKLVRYHELLEFPESQSSLDFKDDSAALSESDRHVQQILEAEAARVYEKIRTNKYLVDGRINVVAIRSDLVHLIEQVARIYQPDSKQPLLETSFNELARAFSRICLHCLALLEQLPLDVRNYTLNELFSYFQRATKAYGAYQMVSPWMQRLGRTAYAGRLAAGANPVTLGAWWLASEVAQRGTRHVVTNVIDRQAIAVLHDLVSVVGTEVANIYGPGYRQRDAAWVYGSELTELLSRFPTSRESLRLALKELTALPLKCEYDRIYLYRCLATSRSAGFLLTDPAALTRRQRDTIAVQLERFVNEVLHGIDDDVLQKWATETESRLDLRLKLGQKLGAASQSTTDVVEDCVRSIWGFSISVLNAECDSTLQQMESGKLLKMLSLEQRRRLLEELQSNVQPEFNVPDLDPSCDILSVYIEELFQCAVVSSQVEAHHFALLMETAMHFRMTESEAEQVMVKVCRDYVVTLSASHDVGKSLNDDQAIAAALVVNHLDILVDAFTSVEAKFRSEQNPKQTDDAALLVFDCGESGERSLTLVTKPFSWHGPWHSVTKWTVKAIEGYVYDDCQLTRMDVDTTGAVDAIDPISDWAEVKTLVLGGAVLNRKFQHRFASLISSPDEKSGTRR